MKLAFAFLLLVVVVYVAAEEVDEINHTDEPVNPEVEIFGRFSEFLYKISIEINYIKF